VPMSRRSFMTVTPLVLTPLATFAQAPPPAREPGAGPSLSGGSPYPTQEPDLIREVVGVSHNNLARLKALVDRQPTLARAAWDWGFGDWESALGAASHVGNRDIAEYLLSKGARPTIFSAAMLGHLDVVKAFVTAQPGVQRTKGPHGITLFAHATAGGERARAVADYLTSLGDADLKPALTPLSADERAPLIGTYTFGPDADQRIEIAAVRDTVGLMRTGRSQRGLLHAGGLEFFPVGAESVRIRFAVAPGGVTLTIHDPDLVLTAKKATTVLRFL
jgi:hypothetical protein